ncbi:PREDICTED: DNA excision repair protein ERCC-6-like 2 isoform X2 [Thamnophis sirtalis]|uniref:DNA excision repair protein ERCC-6-like 2 isoform X2 n=1 Tax=Thamnophis sirtalis TaxID=35019 RepID=A0A6I9YLI0_9SAUR|nr:PREDICTED: DNA excision repair protein ERCC-6-like 2 isoform X2 [Thamnophis sirtalis]
MSFETNGNGKCFASVSTGKNQEEKILTTKLSQFKTNKTTKKNLIFDDEDLEKPYFPDRSLPSPTVAFELSNNGEEVPYTINRYLRDYQREGVQFFHGHYVRKSGCILGDDMGLGKTIQVISFLAAVLKKKGTRADIENNMPDFLLRTMRKEMSSVPKKIFLIVAPLSVLYNWKEELDVWGYFKVIVLHGSRKEHELNRIKLGKCEIVLTTYDALRLYLNELNSLQWSAVIADEVHRIKNPKSQITQTMKALTCKVRLGLTGTILQNNMKELWCVMDWAVPGLLGSKARFKTEFSEPVELGQRHTATKRELATGRKAMTRLAQKLSGYFLRRTKALISDQLPKKEDRTVYCYLTEFQRAVYKTVLETEDVQLVLRAREACSCNSGHKRKNCCYKTNAHGETMNALYFSYVTVLRKIANHAALLQTENTSKQQEAYITRICSHVFSKFPDFVDLSKNAAFETLSDPKYSGKMKLLDVLEQYCMASGLDYRRLDGNTKAEDRVKIVKEFNSTEEVNICLVSTMAGGLGLNFVGANIVILFDPTWNPANDLQAIDRAYRIGQRRNVKVFRLISLGTVEEMMYLRQIYKQQLHFVAIGSKNAKRYFKAVQGSREHQGELFGIRNLFRLQDHGTCLTKEILEREGQVEAGVMTADTWLKEGSQPREETECDYEHQDTKPLEKEALGCSSDFSDEEHEEMSKVQATKKRNYKAKHDKVAEGQLSLLQCGFPKLLEKKTRTAKDGSCIRMAVDENADHRFMREQSKGKAQNDGSVKMEGRNISGCKKTLLSKMSVERQEKLDEEANRTYPVLPCCAEEKDQCKNIYNSNKNKDGIVMDTEDSSSENDIIFPSQFPNGQESIKKFQETDRNSDILAAKKMHLLKPLQKHLTSEESYTNVLPFSKIKPFENIRKTTARNEVSDVSDESEDIEMSISGKQKLTSTMKQKLFQNKERNKSSKTVVHRSSPSRKESNADSQIIEEYSSEEEHFPVKKVNASKKNLTLKGKRSGIQMMSRFSPHLNYPSMTLRTHSNSSRWESSVSKESPSGQGQKIGSLDGLFDNVAEVPYVHSNQHVVGASKAENKMSHWAVRDVFELQQFSQLPANIAVCRAKRSRQSPEDVSSKRKNVKQDHLTSETSRPPLLYITHPVHQKQKRVHRIGSITFLVGKTPRKIRRKQFEEMADLFHKTPVEEFAKYITQTTSEERQKMLKEFYSAKHPELKDILKVDVPASVSEGNKEGGKCKTKFGKKPSICNPGQLKQDLPIDLGVPGRSDAVEKEFQHKLSAQAPGGQNGEDKQLPADILEDSINGRNSLASKDFMASESLSSKSRIIERLSASSSKGQLNLKGTLSPQKRLMSDSASSQAEICQKNAVADLLGDTSILNDLFTSNENSPAERPRRPLNGPAEKAATRPKDFWDMLNEENEECLQRLTDVTAIEKLCERPSFTSLFKEKKESEKSLWKENDNFLWKIDKKPDTDDESFSVI